ncbi:MAG TPA: hypothetical protein VIU11_19400 [Nakamurella sp.]
MRLRFDISQPARRRPISAFGAAFGLVLLLGVSACTSTEVLAERSTAATQPAAAATQSAAGAGESDAGATYAGGLPTASETVSVPPPVTTEVPAPGGGGIDQTVPAVEMTSRPAVSLDQPGEFGNRVAVTLDSVEKITTTAELPGEIAGPGVALTLTIRNGSDAPVDLGAVVVDVADSAGTPTIPMTTSPAAPFGGELAPGQQATGVYVVTLPQNYADPATIAVTYSASAPVVVFAGTLS